MIPALVLTAGLATRLRPLSLLRAKAALPVGGTVDGRRSVSASSAASLLQAQTMGDQFFERDSPLAGMTPGLECIGRRARRLRRVRSIRY